LLFEGRVVRQCPFWFRHLAASRMV
jgi:hypothetical protein